MKNNPKIGTRSLHALPFLFLTTLFVCSSLSHSASEQNSTYNIREFGAVADGETMCTEQIQKAIDTCSENGGGAVHVPSGKYLTGPLFMKDNVRLFLDSGAVLMGSTDFDDYPLIDGRFEGINRKCFASLITGFDAENISIVGPGKLDGQGEVWWEADAKDRPERYRREKEKGDRNISWEGFILEAPRPRVINLYRCKNVLIRDIDIVDSPSWTVHPVYCEDVYVDNVTIISDPESPNTDGINPDSCRNVRISNCYISCGDDNITLKSGYNEYGREVGIPCENIAITNCILTHGVGGIVIGSEMSGDVRNVVIDNCVFRGTTIGIYIKTERGRGGVVENIRANNLVMQDVGIAFQVTMYYTLHSREPQPIDEGTPRFHNIHFSNVSGFDINQTGQFEGLPEMPLSEVSLHNINLKANKGIHCEFCEDFRMRDVIVDCEQGSSVSFIDSSNVELHSVTTRNPNADTPVIEIIDIDRAYLSHCNAQEDTDLFIRLEGSNTRDVRILASDFSQAENAVVLGKDVKQQEIQIE